ncbi:prolipoprotein diacylglyceryl transferase [Mycolicibacterium obuense]|uniref:Phosphatidylglycerol--prolipoprotein diacylglyceryl transferase n=1 Tax=Mycolicibacterium obuense TaxID=1807 RepID=A0A4R5X4A6_9MYCO|nr:prolipoprotein diacylglyceryl transferase [Mycolicibacterium obuense]TDL05712.1 prolipoprotein diacylglyceryl transferase [Mycolicibacterium obuense]
MTSTVLAYIPSPAQGVWHLGPFPLRAYALFIIAGIVAALVLGDRRWVARGGEPGVIYDIALWAVPFGLIGGRLYHVMTDWRTYFGEDGAGFVAALRIWDGGLGIWGAVALGAVGAWIACRRREIPLPAFGDAIAPGIILAQAIGRLGNYFNQELYGRETTMPWGLEIYERVNSAGVPDSLNGVSTGQLIEIVHPTFLYELLWNLLVFAALILVDRRFRIGHGRLFALYVAGYCVGRFWVELMRSDAATHIAGIRINTFTSTFVFIAAVVYIMVAPKGREDPLSLRGKPVDGEVRGESRAEDVVKDVALGASTTGVVAAAIVAAEDDDASSDREADLETVDSDEVAEGDELVAPVDPADETAEPEAGLGSVDADEVAEAVGDAEVAHAVAVEGEDAAEALTVEESEPEGGLGSVDADEVAEAVGDAEVAHAVAVEGEDPAEGLTEEQPEAEAAESEDSEPEGGLGSVDADEVAEAVENADVAHAVAVEGEDAAEGLTEDQPEAEATESEDSEPEGGLGSVDADEVAEAVENADVAHAVAVEGEDAAEALTVEESEPEPEAGLGSVDADEVAEAVGDAEVAHSVAVEGEDAAEGLTADEAADSVEPESSEPEAGLGSVDADEVAEAVGDAEVAHSVAAEGEDAAEALTADQSAETESGDPDAAFADDQGTEDADASETSAVASETPGVTTAGSPAPPVSRPPASLSTEVGQRVIQWVRRRRNR